MLREADTNGDGRIRWAGGGGWGVAAPALSRLLPSMPLTPVLVCTDYEAGRVPGSASCHACPALSALSHCTCPPPKPNACLCACPSPLCGCSKDEFMELLMGTSLPDTLNQYDPRIKLGWAQMDEALEEVRGRGGQMCSEW